HEFVGEIIDLAGASAAARRTWIGKRVAGEINISCSAFGYRPLCRFCKRGLKTHCERRTVLGILGHDGAFAEFLSLPLENLHRIPKRVTDEEAVFIEPLAAACEILKQVKIERFQRAAVLGDGKLAQLIARVLLTRIRHVVMYGKHETKLKLARLAHSATEKVHG